MTSQSPLPGQTRPGSCNTPTAGWSGSRPCTLPQTAGRPGSAAARRARESAGVVLATRAAGGPARPAQPEPGACRNPKGTACRRGRAMMRLRMECSSGVSGSRGPAAAAARSGRSAPAPAAVCWHAAPLPIGAPSSGFSLASAPFQAPAHRQAPRNRERDSMPIWISRERHQTIQVMNDVALNTPFDVARVLERPASKPRAAESDPPALDTARGALNGAMRTTYGRLRAPRGPVGVGISRPVGSGR